MGNPGSIWEISVSSVQFCYEPKNTLKIKSLKKYINKSKQSRLLNPWIRIFRRSEFVPALV